MFKASDNFEEDVIEDKDKRTDQRQTKIDEKVNIFKKAFIYIRNEELGTENDLNDDHDKMIDALIEFTDWCVSCSLKDPTTRDIVLEVNRHQHFDRSCRKKGPTCRYLFPRFPCITTIIAIPSKILFKDEEKEKEMLKNSQDLKNKVMEILEDDDKMKLAQTHREDEIRIHLRNYGIVEEIETILQYRIYKKSNVGKVVLTPKISQDLLIESGMDEDALINSPKEKLIELQNKFKPLMLNERQIECIRKERLDIILTAAEIEGHTFEERNDKYTEALRISSKGYSVFIKRDVDEIMINNYNPEWIKCWSGNMDMQICLDFFAIITYITDYYMKDESGTMKVINEALSNASNANLREKMNIVKNAFLTSRQAGECEIYYKMFPFLNLSYSNIGTEFIHTGFRKNRSRFLKQVPENAQQGNAKIFQVEGKEGKFYVEKEGLIEKYMRRPSCMNISLSQFVKRYEPVRKISKKYNRKQFYIDIGRPGDCPRDVKNENKTLHVVKGQESDSNEDSINDDLTTEDRLLPINETDSIFDGQSFDQDKSIVLPPFIPLDKGTDSCGFQWMKKRSERAIRFHKFNKTKDPHQWYYSEMLLYLPFQVEECLYPDDFEKCRALYLTNLDKINTVKHQVMPYLTIVTEARERAEEFISNIGDDIDATKEQQEDTARAEGTREHPDLSVVDPTDFIQEGITVEDRTFRKIELQSDSLIFEQARTLDCDQREVLDRIYSYAIKFHQAQKNRKNGWPQPPLLMVHGGAGTGKSHIIECVSQLVEKVFRTSGDDPNHPYVLKLGFTGNAASIIKGQTIHSALQLPFGNNHITLSDKMRDLRRKQLKNLRILILDEVSLIRADMLYQIHFRLMEIFQNKLDFGNISILALGDILQIKPPLGTMIYACPRNEKSANMWKIPGGNLWSKFDVITLKTNHRQGDNRTYAELLNRVRIGEHTSEDISMLETRVFPRNHPELPASALVVTGVNKIVKRVNDKRLNDLSGRVQTITAHVSSRLRGQFKPRIDNAGQVKNTPLQYELNIKKYSRIMLTMNLDVCDGLSNGAIGEVVDYVLDSIGEVTLILVKFDNDDVGKQYRKEVNYNKEYPGQNIVAIKKIEFDFQLREGSTSSATAINFPLRLAWATTCHKIQVTT